MDGNVPTVRESGIKQIWTSNEQREEFCVSVSEWTLSGDCLVILRFHGQL